MYTIANSKNLEFIQQYITGDAKVDTTEIKVFKKYDELIEQVRQANLKSIDVLENLNIGYISTGPVLGLLKEQGLNFDSNGQKEVSLEIQHAFDELMLDVGRKMVGYHVAKSGQAKFNHKSFAECVMQLYSLLINEQDPDNLVIYNKDKGFWEEATQPLHRLIIEIAHAAGGNIEDSWSSHLEKSVVDILKRKIVLEKPGRFNQDYFPLGNCTLNSSTGDLEPHASSHRATFGCSINYNPDSDCSVFKQFLTEVFDDIETIRFVQEWFGYTLSSNHKANSFLIGIGAGGNGKSTLFDILAQLVGIDNVSSAPLSNFNSEFGLEPLIGKKLNLATESDVDAFKTGKLKALTAGEDISINRKNKMEITTKLPTKLVFLMNELPLLSDDSFGFVRRLIILPFDKTFNGNQQDKDLPLKLSSELEGILSWSLEGLSRLIANNYAFTISESMQNAKNLYLGVGNPIERFVAECLVAKPSNVMDSKELLHAYSIWMSTNELPFKGTDSPQKFWKLFEEAMDLKLISFSRGKSNGRTVVRDIALN